MTNDGTSYNGSMAGFDPAGEGSTPSAPVRRSHDGIRMLEKSNILFSYKYVRRDVKTRVGLSLYQAVIKEG